MKYLVRAVKYFVYFSLIVTVVITLLVALDIVEADVNAIFKDGYNSIWKIAFFFALFAAIYPSTGFVNKEALFNGGLEANKPAIKAYMEEKGYVLETDEAELMTFRQRSLYKRVNRMWEDRISFVAGMTGAKVEGYRRDVIPVISGIEHRLRADEEEQ